MTKRPKLQYIVLTILLLWAFTAQLTYSGYRIYVQANASRSLQVPEFTRRIAGFLPGYGNSGLKINDQILALNGRPITGSKRMEEMRFGLHPGEILTVTVRRAFAGRSETLSVPISMRASPSGSAEWFTVLGLSTFLPLSCLLVGFYIAFARPRDPLAWITFGMLAAFSQLAGSGYSWAIWSP